MKYYKITTWSLAISMFMFGVLKFVNPFKNWYSVQVTNSNLGELSYTLGILGEITVGTTLFLCLLYRPKISNKIYKWLTSVSFLAISIMMMTGIYVHLHPNVPANVLPLKIKPPYIPIFFLLIALSNFFLTITNSKIQDRKEANR
ncbi:hypothetical protein [Pedobacter insulae]|uniref:DoxX-like family protein n=1 Tax=Pedobacter insulae TaxID=414048 RepID=A0A1I2T5H8_9SPHI|nr:hypothetical protein [Pedobacter insulae]SFG58447.1 hypothetical protein SAMN04489864_101148 [Pedobacter insulae]